MNLTPRADRLLHVVERPDPHRKQGGQPADHWASPRPWAKLPDMSYWCKVGGWYIAPYRYVEREPLSNATERERDYRVHLTLEVLDVDESDPGDRELPAAKSALFQHRTHQEGRLRIPASFRVAVGATSGRMRIPKGGTLWTLFDALGQRPSVLTPDLLDSLIGQVVCVRTYVQRRKGSRKRGVPGSRIPRSGQYSRVLDVEDVRAPAEPNR